MSLFMIERNFAEKLQVTSEGAATINEINDQENVRWIISFLSVDRAKTFCLYEAPNKGAILKAAKRAGIPADAIIEVRDEIIPSGVTRGLRLDRFGQPQS